MVYRIDRTFACKIIHERQKKKTNWEPNCCVCKLENKMLSQQQKTAIIKCRIGKIWYGCLKSNWHVQVCMRMSLYWLNLIGHKLAIKDGNLVDRMIYIKKQPIAAKHTKNCTHRSRFSEIPIKASIIDWLAMYFVWGGGEGKSSVVFFIFCRLFDYIFRIRQPFFV